MGIESQPHGQSVSKSENLPSRSKSVNELAPGDFVIEYGAHLLRKYGRGNQVVLILDDNPKLERLADAYEEFHVVD